METYREDGNNTFLGAVGIEIRGDSLVEVGRATHTDDVPLDESYPSITRALVDDGSLYTLSYDGIERGDLDDLSERAFERF
jgi:hypothetical protein